MLFGLKMDFLMGSGHPLEDPGHHSHTLGLPGAQKTAHPAPQPG